MMTMAEVIPAVANLISKERFEHSVCVSRAAYRLAPGFGADPEKAMLAGMIHDCLKEQPDEVLLNWMGGSAIIGDNDLTGLRPLWHAWAGAEYIKTVMDMPEDICSAVRYHTSGKADMTPLEKTLFLADYISDDRTFEGSAKVREIAKTDQELACLTALQTMICHIVSSGRKLDLNSPAAYNYFVRQLSAREVK